MSDGGTAFPVTLGTQPDRYLCGPGMSLRDHFAGLAMQCVIAGNSDMSPETMAQEAYEAADAMLRERERK
jgi:hypothetical protein